MEEDEVPGMYHERHDMYDIMFLKFVAAFPNAVEASIYTPLNSTLFVASLHICKLNICNPWVPYTRKAVQKVNTEILLI